MSLLDRLSLSTTTRRHHRSSVLATPTSGQFPWSPLAISGCKCWLDAADASTITSSGSPAKVSQWNDKSGFGNNVSQSTGTLQPTTGSTTRNGLNVLTWTGAQALRSSNGALSEPIITAWCVANINSAYTNRSLIQVPHNATQNLDPYNRWSIYYGSSGWWSARVDGVIVFNNVSMPANAYNSYRLDTAYAAIYSNSTLGASGTGSKAMSYPNSVPFIVGANAASQEGFYGQMCEVIVYNRQLSHAELANVEKYLKAKWAL